MFSYREEQIRTTALSMTFHLAPWDRPVFEANTAVITSIHLGADIGAAQAFEGFHEWCETNQVRLVSCRLDQEQLTECGFLEARGFRFIELNYRPTVTGLDGFPGDPQIPVCLAEAADEAEICDIAGQIFATGRLHLDPQVGPEIGNRRYAAWAANAFRHPAQQVFKCLMEDRIVAFMVVEHPMPSSRFWSLTGLAPGSGGQGLGRRVWQAMLALHHREGVRQVSTSISSHNTVVHNLYASLGFRFPPPAVTLHWCPSGPLRRPMP